MPPVVWVWIFSEITHCLHSIIGTFLLFSLHHQQISIVFTPPPPPHFFCFHFATATFLLSSPHHHYTSTIFTPLTSHLYCFHSTNTTFILFLLHQQLHHHCIYVVFTPTTTCLLFSLIHCHISIVFTPPPVHFYCPFSTKPYFYCLHCTTNTSYCLHFTNKTFLLFSLNQHHTCIVLLLYHHSSIFFTLQCITTFELSLPEHHHISIAFTPPPLHFYFLHSTNTKFRLSSLHLTTSFLLSPLYHHVAPHFNCLYLTTTACLLWWE